MFDKYGPNSLKINSYIKALRSLTSQQVEGIRLREYELTNIRSVIKKVNNLNDKRVEERKTALKSAEEALGNKGTQNLRLLVSSIASWLVLEDFLETTDRNFLYLYLINQFVPLNVLNESYRKEDRAIEVFCDQLSKIDGQRVFIHSRPDSRGKGEDGLPDFIICRKGVNYTGEHTSINSYNSQEHYNKLWNKFIKPLKIEEKVNLKYQNKWIDIRIPMDIFRSENEANKFDFVNFMQKLFEGIDQAPESHNANKPISIEFSKPNFEVQISRGEGKHGCFLVGIAPTNTEEIDSYLDKRIIQAIETKQPKLKRAKEKEERTILLLDSDDFSFVNIHILSDAFSRSISKNTHILNGIDEIYILHQGGVGVVAPVKLGERFYPDLHEFDEYICKEFGISNFN